MPAAVAAPLRDSEPSEAAVAVSDVAVMLPAVTAVAFTKLARTVAASTVVPTSELTVAAPLELKPPAVNILTVMPALVIAVAEILADVSAFAVILVTVAVAVDRLAAVAAPEAEKEVTSSRPADREAMLIESAVMFPALMMPTVRF